MSSTVESWNLCFGLEKLFMVLFTVRKVRGKERKPIVLSYLKYNVGRNNAMHLLQFLF